MSRLKMPLSECAPYFKEKTNRFSCRNLITIFLRVVVAMGLVMSGAAPAWASLVGLYRFDDPNNLGKDSSVLHNDLVVFGNGVSYTSAGRVGGGLSLAGAGGLSTPDMSVPKQFPLGNMPYTISAWFRTTEIYSDCRTSCIKAGGIIGWGAYGTDNAVNALLLWNAAGGAIGNGGIHHYWNGNDMDGVANVSDGVFHNVTVTFDGAQRDLYFDGKLLNSDSPGDGHDVQNKNFAIGVTNLNVNEGFLKAFKGVLDDIAVYDNAATAGDVIRIMREDFSLAGPVSPSSSGSPAARAAGTFTITVHACIDNADVLEIQGTNVAWENLAGTPPGIVSGENNGDCRSSPAPTQLIDSRVVGVFQWTPTFPNGNGQSDTFTAFRPGLPQAPIESPTLSFQGRGSVIIDGPPTPANNYGLKIRFSDPQSGADWYTATVTIRPILPPPSGSVTGNASGGAQIGQTGPAQGMPSAPECAQGGIPTNGCQPGATGGQLRLMSGTGDFSPISATNRTLYVRPGAMLNGSITLGALNLGPSSAVAPLIYTPSWGNPAESWKLIQNSLPSGRSEQAVQLSLQVPTDPGTYHIIFAFQWEVGGDHVASATNWSLKTDIWNDGNDIAALNDDQLARAQLDGYTRIKWLVTSGYTLEYVPVDAVTLVVKTPISHYLLIGAAVLLLLGASWFVLMLLRRRPTGR